MQRKLLALLLIDAGSVVPRDRIIDALWGERPPDDVRNAVRFHASRLRRALTTDADMVLRVRDGYLLAADASQIDARVFEHLLQEASETAGDNPAGAVAALDEALALWNGAPFAGATYDEFAVAEIRRLEAVRVRALELRLDLLMHLDRSAEVIEVLGPLVVEFPIHQGFAEALLAALNGSGRPAEALDEYRRVEDRFRTELGIDPPEAVRRLAAESRALIEDPTWTDPRHPHHNIVRPISSYIARGDEIGSLRARITQRRLTTLLGPGGVGKTRLAQEAVAGMAAEFRDGVWLVDLVPVVDDRGLASAVAAVTGLAEPARDDPAGDLARHLARSDMLIVLDNCEHLIPGCAVLAQSVLSMCPLVRIVATSREPLGVAGETVFPVEPLVTPGSGADVAEAQETPAFRLFAERSRDASGREVADEASEEVIALTRRLAGLPLAIEMAAARTRDVAPAEITALLNSHLARLTSGRPTGEDRHHSLAAAFRWSYELLTESQQAVFRALSVFRGGFTIDAAAAVAGVKVSSDFADLFGGIVNASLVTRSDDRYRLLEPIREFAADVLEATEETEDSLARHTCYYEALAYEQRAAEGRVVHSPEGASEPDDRMAIVARVDRDIGNYRAAVRRAVEIRDRRSALEIASGVSQYLAGRLSIRENAELLSAALDLDGDVPEELIVDALLGLAWSLVDLGDNDGAEQAASRALHIARQVESDVGEADALLTLGNAAFERGDLILARERIQGSIDACATVEPSRTSLHGLAMVNIFLGDTASAEAMHERLATRGLDDQLRAYLPRTQAMIEASRGKHDAALVLFERGLEACTTDRARHEGLRFVAHAHLNLGDMARARTLAEYVHADAVKLGMPSYAERTANLLGLLDVRERMPGPGIQYIATALESAVSRPDRYRAWSFLCSAAEALVALDRGGAALGLLRLAEDIADEYGYWLPALDWVPHADRASVEMGHADDAIEVVNLEAAVDLLRSAVESP
ncbi:MAG: BTAD domain-containing putative transcriptional regulator [Actinomycetota bacterium]